MVTAEELKPLDDALDFIFDKGEEHIHNALKRYGEKRLWDRILTNAIDLRQERLAWRMRHTFSGFFSTRTSRGKRYFTLLVPHTP